MRRRSGGMTLVEILIALAIASLMTLTGWRAVDALQSSRDRVVGEAAQWQRMDDFFVTIEADLRRASINDFSGDVTSFAVLQPSLDGGIEVQLVRYRAAAFTGSLGTDGQQGVSVVRESGDASVPLVEVQSLSIAYSADGIAFEPSANVYPRAIRITMLPMGATSPVERLLALR